MGGIRTDDSVQSANLPTQEYLAQNQGGKDYNLYRCMVTKVRYVDDPTNITSGSQNPQVIYDCIIIGGPKEGQILVNVRAGTGMGGGQYNYEERTYRAASKPFAGTGSAGVGEQDGDVVFVSFVNGNLNAPTIIAGGVSSLGGYRHPATSGTGPLSVDEFNGVETKITNDGTLTITRKGGAINAKLKAYIPNPDGQEAQLKFAKNLLSLLVKAGAIKLTMDGGSNQLAITFSSGQSLTLNGGDDSVIAKTKAGATMKLKAGKVALGTSSTEVVDVLSQTLNLLSTDLGNLGLPLINAPQYAALKAQLDAIKGSV